MLVDGSCLARWVLGGHWVGTGWALGGHWALAHSRWRPCHIQLVRKRLAPTQADCHVRIFVDATRAAPSGKGNDKSDKVRKSH